jgi:chromosome partitioning protein
MVFEMNQQVFPRFDHEIAQQGARISGALNALRMQQYPPDARKGNTRSDGTDKG